MWRVTFASDEGPSLEEAEALVRACPALDAPAERVQEVLRGTSEVVVTIDAGPNPRKFALGAVEGLRSAGARAEPVRYEQYGREWIASALGVPEALSEGEHRWTFTPSHRPEIVIRAFEREDGWMSR